MKKIFICLCTILMLLLPFTETKVEAEGDTRVYIYLKYELRGNVQPPENWHINDIGWLTVGYIDVPGSILPEVDELHVNIGAYSGGEPYAAAVSNYVINHLGNIIYYPQNEALAKKLDLPTVIWSGVNETGLKPCDGATDYDAPGHQWHLDGKRIIEETYTVIYKDYDGSVLDSYQGTALTQPVQRINNPTRDKYYDSSNNLHEFVFAGWSSTGLNNEGLLIADATFTAIYKEVVTSIKEIINTVEIEKLIELEVPVEVIVEVVKEVLVEDSTEIERLNSIIEQLNERITELEQLLTEKENTITELQTQLEEAQGTIKELETIKIELLTQIEDLTKEIVTLKETITELTTTIENLKIQLVEKENKITELETRIEQLVGENTELTNIITELRKTISNQETYIEKIEEKLTETEKVVTEQSLEIIELKEIIAGKDEEIEKLLKQIEELLTKEPEYIYLNPQVVVQEGTTTVTLLVQMADGTVIEHYTYDKLTRTVTNEVTKYVDVVRYVPEIQEVEVVVKEEMTKEEAMAKWNLVDAAPDTLEIEEEETPLSSGASWSIMNLVLMVITACFALFNVLGLIGNDIEKYVVSCDETIKKHMILRILTMIIATLLMILFRYTQRIQTAPQLFDEYSIIFAILFIISIVLTICSTKQLGDKE